MDERWLLDMIDPPPTGAEVIEFGNRTARVGDHVVWTGPTDPGGHGLAPFRADVLTTCRLAFALTYGGLPRSPYRVKAACGNLLCVTPKCLVVAAPDDYRDT